MPGPQHRVSKGQADLCKVFSSCLALCSPWPPLDAIIVITNRKAGVATLSWQVLSIGVTVTSLPSGLGTDWESEARGGARTVVRDHFQEERLR